MILALGRIEDKNSLIGVRIYDTNKKSIKDIKIEDTDKIKIKNKSKIYRLGVVDNKTEDKPLILLGYKDRKALVIDINGRTNVLEDTSKYETVTIKSNIEEYEKYIYKLRLLGAEEVFNYEVKEDTDEVLITKYIPNNEEERVIEIPSFVTGIKKDHKGNNTNIFEKVTQSLKVIHRYNQIKEMDRLFYKFKGEKLDLRNFDTSNVKDMHSMFCGCEKLKELDIRNFDTSNVTDMNSMFSCCTKLKELDISNFDTSKVENMGEMFFICLNLNKLDLRNFDTSQVKDMNYMFCRCSTLKELDLSNFDTSKVENMSHMFSGCEKLKELDVRNFNTSKVKNMSFMFNKCRNLKELDLSNFDISNVKNMESMFDGTSLTEENTGLR